MTGSELVSAERSRQIQVEGWSEGHDLEHAPGTLALAALVYIGLSLQMLGVQAVAKIVFTYLWPWQPSWLKPKDLRRNLVKAGALICAELDRMQADAQRRGTPYGSDLPVEARSAQYVAPVPLDDAKLYAQRVIERTLGLADAKLIDPPGINVLKLQNLLIDAFLEGRQTRAK